jgi:site-specific recombinase XerD
VVVDLTNSIINYRRYLKRRNLSRYTIRNYLNNLKHFLAWLKIPLEQATHQEVSAYTEFLLEKIKHPKTINCQLSSIRSFYDFLHYDEGFSIQNPARKGCSLRLPKPLPRYLLDEEVERLFSKITNRRDRAIFMIMLRCGLRVAEVAALTIDSLDQKRRKVFIQSGKGGKGRVVYLSNDAFIALTDYLKIRPTSTTRHVFLAGKGNYRGKPISIRGIQKRIEYYRGKVGMSASCHHLRHTMATQMLNVDADLATIQDLLGHSKITTTQRYCTVSNIKVERDYNKAMEKVLQKNRLLSNVGVH